MAVKAIAALKNGWRCAWVDTEYSFGDSGTGSFQITGMDAEHRTEEILEVFETIVQMRNTNPRDSRTDNYETSRTWEVGEIRIRKHKGPTVSMIVNDCRVLFHADCECCQQLSRLHEKL